MKHNFLKIALVAAVVATAGYGVYENQRQDMMSEVILANVEALARYETNDCHYVNGVTNIQLEESFWHSTKHSYYDCCGNPVEGYDYEDYCK